MNVTALAAVSLLLAFGVVVPGRDHAPLAPVALTVGDRDTPLGVAGTPLFGWQPRDRDPGERQTAYQIRVYDPQGDTPLWDSGKQASPQTAFIPYAGSTLTGGATYHWTVRTWDRKGAASPWAARAAFGTAIADEQWQASWIRRTTAERDDYTLARTEFTVGAASVVRARLYLAASQQYQAFVNGRLVDHGPAFAYPGEGYYQVSDVTGDLRAGRRAALGVLYHWYGPGQGRPAGEPGLLARLVVDHADGSRQVVLSDGTWRVTRGPWLPAAYRNGDGRDYIEHVDGRAARRQEGWSEPGFDDSAWQAPQVLGVHPAGVFTRLRAQQTRLTYRTVHPVSVTTLAGGAVVADFGTVIPATPQVRFRAGVDGRKVSMWAGFLRNEDGSVANTGRTNQSTDLSYSYLQHDGEQTFRALTYEGFRYLQIADPGEPLDARAITAVVQHTDADPARAATFTSSDRTLDAVFALLQRSALYSAQEQFLDTPTREKGQFLADAVNISRALMAGSGDRALTARAIREFIASQQRYWPDGRLNAVYPNGDGRRDIPDFTELFPGWSWDYYLASGDRTLLGEAYPVSVAVAEYVRRHRDPNTGLVTNLTGGSGAYQYGIIDWPNRYDYDTATVARTTVNILAVEALRSTARQAEALGRPPGEAAALYADADALAAAVNTRLRRADGIYIDGLTAAGAQSGHASQIANAYAVAFGIAPSGSVAAVTGHLTALKLRMGPMTADVLLAALHRAGRDDEVLARLTDTTSIGWADILARGGTFTWESWEAPERGDSMSHGWGSAALTDLLRDLLGVSSTAPAARTLLIAPPRGTGLTHAAGTVWTQAGTVTIAWRAGSAGAGSGIGGSAGAASGIGGSGGAGSAGSGGVGGSGAGSGGISLAVDVPVNVTAEIRVPVTGDNLPRARGTGPDGGRSPRFEGIRDGVAVYTVGSGHSTFTSAR